MSELKFWNKNSFLLESGESIEGFTQAYQTFGNLNKEKNNVVWVFHGLTANSKVFDWWPGLFGTNDLFNEEEHFVICANALGSPYGSSAPVDELFPFFTIRDVVKAQVELAEFLGIKKIKVAIGGSFGGSQALEFGYSFTGEIEKLILIACSARETAWGIAIHESQRLAMKADPTFGSCEGGKEGLKAARAIGMLTYRTSQSLIQQQTDHPDKIKDFKASSYIRYQGDKFQKRFNSICYYYLTQCLDSHNIGRNRGGEEKALYHINIPSLVIGIDTDALIPNQLQKHLVQHLKNAEYKEVQSSFGHDGFLIETKQLKQHISSFISN